MRRTLLAVAVVLTASASLLAQAAKRPAITGLAFARFYTTDAPAADRFYSQTLGFGKQQADGVSVYPINHSQWIEVVSSAPPAQNIRIAAIGFTTTDAAALQRYLAAHGVAAEQPLAAGRFSVRDPEGNLIVFVQRGANQAVASADPSSTGSSRSMIHAGFIVHDRVKEDAFWRNILGFRPYWFGGQTDARTDYVSLQVPEGTDWLEYMLNNSDPPNLHQAGVANHISLGVVEMSDAVAALARNHCEGANCAKTQMGRDGKIQLNLFDPDFTRIEFMEFAPRKEPCCSPFTARNPDPAEVR